jgi:hypothetical protein
MRSEAALARQQLNLVAACLLDPTFDCSHQCRPDPGATLPLVNRDILDNRPRLPTVGQIRDDHDVNSAKQPLASHGHEKLTARISLNLGKNATALGQARRL